MSKNIRRSKPVDKPIPEREFRPTGAWVVSGFLLLVTLLMWAVVASVFQARS